MRTTIELTDEQRAELLRIAAKRRLKGFSPIVQEAVDAYIRQQGGKDQAIAVALTLRGTFDGNAGEEFASRVKAAREKWR